MEELGIGNLELGQAVKQCTKKHFGTYTSPQAKSLFQLNFQLRLIISGSYGLHTAGT
jgi:hypothetical protein